MEKWKVIYEDGTNHFSKKIGKIVNKDSEFLTLIEDTTQTKIMIPISRIIRVEVVRE